MRVFLLAAMSLLVSGVAYAGNEIVDPEKLPENVAVDQRYRSSLQRLPDPKDTHDPWGYMRPVETGKNDKSKQSNQK